MKTELIAVFAIISLVAAQTTDGQEQNCKPNESFKSCGTACEPSCENPKPEICTEQCVSGCQCDDGFYRNSNKECVKLEDCKAVPTKCHANETFTECYNSCSEKKCPSRFAPGPVCNKLCRQGCGCSKGYVRNLQRQCVKRSDCPIIIRFPTPAPVPASTENPCNLVDCQSGLICKLKYGKPTCVRAKRSVSDIVEPVDSNPCHWTKCAAGKKCILRQVMCIKGPCNPIAVCVDEYSTSTEPSCPQNEEMVLCKSPCSDQQCGQTEPMACTMECRGPGCACKTGFFRNTSGSCVSQQECGTQPNGRIRIRN